MTKASSINELLEHLDQKIKSNSVIDSVHKIKLITAREMIQKLLSETS